ncbi:MAG: hypothetical protein EOO44_14125 [Flavobacterium sp.]|nr:MAG: hypothetical protein EOO44_14125 [Flavobacterium sp.]
MIEISVTEENIKLAKQQISDFEKTDAGSWRYTNVEAWRGIVCEMVVSTWLSDNFEVSTPAKGLDTSGIVDDYDLIIKGRKIEIKSATKNYFSYIMPKVDDVDNHPKDIYIAAKYNETVEPNKVYLIGFMSGEDIKKYPKDQNKGAPYYRIPIKDFKDIGELRFI